MGKTERIELNITSAAEDTKRYKDFRLEVAGDDPNSNMMIIDREIGKLKDHADSLVMNDEGVHGFRINTVNANPEFYDKATGEWKKARGGGHGLINPFDLIVDENSDLWSGILDGDPPELFYNEETGELFITMGAWNVYPFELDESYDLWYLPPLIRHLQGVISGSIIMWSGSILDIPYGWVLCDGRNDTPDLRNRFVVGAGNAYQVGNVGGQASVVLTDAQMPSHTHSGSRSGSVTAQTGTGATATATTTANTGATGGGQAHENRPPYYALAYIMKT